MCRETLWLGRCTKMIIPPLVVYCETMWSGRCTKMSLMLCIFPYDETDDLSLRLCFVRPMEFPGRLILRERERIIFVISSLACVLWDLWTGQEDWSWERMKNTSLAKECWKCNSHGRYFHHEERIGNLNLYLPPKKYTSRPCNISSRLGPKRHPFDPLRGLYKGDVSSSFDPSTLSCLCLIQRRNKSKMAGWNFRK